MEYTEAFAARFWRRVVILEAGKCWPWMRAISDGYGSLWAGGAARKAHRVAYELSVGPVPDGLILDHTCHNGSGCEGGPACRHRRCCNPAHLEPVEPAVNTERGESGSRLSARTHCPRGHEYTPENTLTQKGRYRLCRECHRQDSANTRARAAERRTLQKEHDQL